MSISTQARRVFQGLQQHDWKVVFAESCTGGLVSGALTKVPGISAHHCGGVVVYRNETKTEYLGIPTSVLKKPGPVSREVAELMARRVLSKTPEANIAAAVTGHLGPDAPAKLDGVVFIAVALREGKKKARVTVRKLNCKAQTTRVVRQRLAIETVLKTLADAIPKS